MNEFIRNLTCSSRAKRALTQLGVTDVESLIDVTSDSVLCLRNCSQVTWNEIAKIQYAIRADPPSHLFDRKTLRDEFAMAALTGWLASFGPDQVADHTGCAEFAYKIADAMLEARK